MEGKMKKLIWGKTLLEAYKYMNRLIKSIDRLVVDKGVHSHFSYNGEGKKKKKMEAIIDLIQRKKRLLVIKMLTEEGVKNLDEYNAKLLVRYYFDKVDTLTIANEVGESRRTVHRHINNAILDFMDKVNELGYTSKQIETMLENENWIVGIYNGFVAKYQHKDKSLYPLTIPPSKQFDRIIKTVYTGA